MHPVLIDFHFFKLHTYGLMIAIAFLVGMQLGVREARRIDLALGAPKKDFDQFILDLCFWILLVAMAGSRVLFVIVNWDEYSHDPIKIFRFWEGGFVFYGGLIASVLFSVYYCMKKGRDFFVVADMLIPSVALGQFFGRLGCFAAGCCWGGLTDSSNPFAVQFPEGSLAYSSMQRSGQIGHEAWTLHVHPTQLYESTGTLALFFILILLRARKRFNGQLLLTYLFFYPILRSTIEAFRGDKERGVYHLFGNVNLSTGQIVSIIVATSAISLLIYLLRRRSHGGDSTPPVLPDAA